MILKKFLQIFKRKKITKTSYSIEEFSALLRARNKTRFGKLSDQSKKVFELLKDIPESEKDTVNHFLRLYIFRDIPDKYNPETTHQDIRKFQDFLMQECIDYLKETGNTEIQNIYFTASHIQRSVVSGEWVPDTDSSLVLEGLGTDGYEHLGESF